MAPTPYTMTGLNIALATTSHGKTQKALAIVGIVVGVLVLLPSLVYALVKVFFCCDDRRRERREKRRREEEIRAGA